MSYKVEIRNNETGEIRIKEMNLEWSDGSLFWWTEGNFGCDCNREMQFGTDKEFDDIECGETRFSVLKVILPDGTEYQIDEK